MLWTKKYFSDVLWWATNWSEFFRLKIVTSNVSVFYWYNPIWTENWIFFTMIQSLFLQLSPQLDFTLVFRIWVKKMSLQVPPGGLGGIQQIGRCSTSCSPEILTWTGVLVCVSRMLATRSRPRASVSFDPADHRPSAGRMRSHDSIRPLPKSHVTRFLWWLHHLSGNFVGWLNRL